MNIQVNSTNRSPSEPDGPVEFTVLAPVARFNLRVKPDGIAAASQALRQALPHAIGECTGTELPSALCLGPHEWILHVDEVERDTATAAFAAIYEATPHSLTDISDREIGVGINGARARELLSIGCPLDLDLFRPGRGTRTLFDTVEIILYRDSQVRFRIDVARSLLPHVWSLLATANAELASGF